MNDETQDKNLFDELGLSVEYGEVSVGELYPLYGAITKFIDDTLGNVVILINDHIEATLQIDDQDKLDLLKNRSFEPGIFMCTILQKDPTIKAECSTVIFGKNNNNIMQ